MWWWSMRDATAELEMGVLNNDYWIWQFQSYGADVVQEKNKRAGFFPNHEDIHVRMTGSRGNFNPGGGKCDIVVFGIPVEDVGGKGQYGPSAEPVR